MKKFSNLLTIGTVFSMISVTCLNAMGPGSMGGGQGMQGGPGKGKMERMQNSFGMAKYNKYTVITINAIVTEVGSNETNKHNQGQGTHLYVTSDKGNYKIHVAPEFWMKKKGITFTEGEKLEITGSEFQVQDKRGGGSDNIYAATIVKSNGETIKFRDPETGTGLWKSAMKEDMQKQNMMQRQEQMRAKMMKQMQEQMRNKMMQQMQNSPQDSQE